MATADAEDLKDGIEESMGCQPNADALAAFLTGEWREDELWFSHGYKEKDVEDMERLDAEIYRAKYSKEVPKPLGLRLDVEGCGGGTRFLQLEGEDINELMARTDSNNYADLKGKEVEVYVDGGEIKAMGVPHQPG